MESSEFATRQFSSGAEMLPLNPVLVLLPPAAVTAAMLGTSGNTVSPISVVCAHAILQAAWGSYLVWKERKRGGLPMFAMSAFIYWIFFAVPLFLGERTLLVGHMVEIGDDYVTQTMIMTLIGVICLWAGMKLPLRTPSVRDLPDVDERSSSLAYVRIVLVATTLIGLYPPAMYLLGAGGRQVMIVLSTTVPAVAFLLLLRRCWMGMASPVDKPLLLATAAIRIAGSLASGWLGPVISLGLMVVALYLVMRGRIPWTPILLTIAAIFFLQVGKDEFRSAYWWGDKTGGLFERAKFWVSTSASSWADAFQSGGSNKTAQLASRTVQRATLLTQVAHVLELTPSQVPFQNGQTYSYFAVTLIPRLVWPDKPSVSDANRFYQLAYGLSDARTVESTSIAIGSMAEGYINFGWLGVILVMLGLGVVLRAYERLCTVKQTNTLILAIGISLLPQLVTIESQLGQYLAGMFQQIILAFTIFLPVTRRKSRTASRVVVPAFRFREHPAQPLL